MPGTCRGAYCTGRLRVSVGLRVQGLGEGQGNCNPMTMLGDVGGVRLGCKKNYPILQAEFRVWGLTELLGLGLWEPASVL